MIHFYILRHQKNKLDYVVNNLSLEIKKEICIKVVSGVLLFVDHKHGPLEKMNRGSYMHLKHGAGEKY
jgi:hypothetical protein